MIKICVVCGKEFATKLSNKKTCSPECSKEHALSCSKAYHAKKRAENLEQKIPFDKTLAYLKDEHAQQIIIKKLNECTRGEIIPPFCHTCGQDFTPKFKGEKYCSDECRFKSPLWRILLDRYKNYGAEFSL